MKTQIRVRGEIVEVPTAIINGRTIIVTGKGVKVASVLDEKLTPGDVVSEPEPFIAAVKKSLELDADLFTFAQKPTESTPRFNYPFEWENAAVIPITTYDEWLNNRAASDVRQNVRKSARRGVDVRRADFDDSFVHGIVGIFNESPIRQGRPFWHYGKTFDQVKEEIGHCIERSYFIGAYVEDELVGFIKLLQTGEFAELAVIVCKVSHREKRPTNALIAKAVETCIDENIGFLSYAEFHYYKNKSSSLAEFKKRNGFERIDYPRYYIPLTLKGRIAASLNLHHGIKGVIPEPVLDLLRTVRAKFVASTQSDG